MATLAFNELTTRRKSLKCFVSKRFSKLNWKKTKIQHNRLRIKSNNDFAKPKHRIYYIISDVQCLFQFWSLTTSNVQAFIQALLYAAVFPQRLSFFTVCLVQWLRVVTPWQTPKRQFLKFRSADRRKMYFSWIFRTILEFYGEFWGEI